MAEFTLRRSSPIISEINALALKTREIPVCSPDIPGLQTQISQKVSELRDALEQDIAGCSGTPCPTCPTSAECPPPASCPPPPTCPTCEPCPNVTPSGQPANFNVAPYSPRGVLTGQSLIRGARNLTAPYTRQLAYPRVPFPTIPEPEGLLKYCYLFPRGTVIEGVGEWTSCGEGPEVKITKEQAIAFIRSKGINI